MGAVVEVRHLQVVARSATGETPIVQDITFTVQPGEVLALIGESGSGKTTIALAIMGYAREGCRIAGGSVNMGGREVPSFPMWRKARRRPLILRDPSWTR